MAGNYLNTSIWSGKLVLRDYETSDNYNFESPAWISGFSGNKGIVSTQTEAGDGTIVEFTGRSPYTFDLNVLVLNTTLLDLPTQINLIRQLYELNQPIQIEFDYLKRWNITQLIILDISVEQEDPNKIEVTLSCQEYSEVIYRQLELPTEEQTFLATLEDLTEEDQIEIPLTGGGG